MSCLVVGYSQDEMRAKNSVSKLRSEKVRNICVLVNSDSVAESSQGSEGAQDSAWLQVRTEPSEGFADGLHSSAAGLLAPFAEPLHSATTIPFAGIEGAVMGGAAGGAVVESAKADESVETVGKALSMLGFPDSEISRFADGVDQGRYLIVSRCEPAEADHVEKILAATEAQNIETLSCKE